MTNEYQGKPLNVAAINNIWVKAIGNTPENKSMLLNEYDLDIDLIHDMESDENYLYLPMHVMVGDTKDIAHRRSLIIIVGDEKLITIQDAEDFTPFNSALRHLRRHPGALNSTYHLLALLLHALNEEASKVIATIGSQLEDSSDDITAVTSSLNTGREVGISDISGTMIDLNEKEELVSRCLESQLTLARATRYLDADVPESDTELQGIVRSLREDINGVKEHATFEHDKVRYLQNAILASLNIKQNQIVKVFTIITAVFLPPTLIASLYGMNFAVMPELSWEHGFPASILLTLVASLLPMFYIKYRGWLR